MANPFVHLELSTTDAEKAKAFYGALFTWKMQDMPMGPGVVYTMIQPGEGPGGGLLQETRDSGHSSWLPYVTVDDVKASTAKAAALGATVVKDVSEVPQMGWFSIIIDPTGAALGLWQHA